MNEGEGLTAEQRMHVLHAARAGILELVCEHPELAIRLDADDLARVYLAGLVAGVEAAVRVFQLVSDERS
jgi:hypothetical protein